LPEPSEIEGKQQVAIKWDKSDLLSLFSSCQYFAPFNHRLHDTVMTPHKDLSRREEIVALASEYGRYGWRRIDSSCVVTAA
jgi:hypothetical protein